MIEKYKELVRASALCATLLAAVLLIIKIMAWWYTGSVSLLAAVVDSIVDIASATTNLLVVRYSLQPADKEHRFGHGKAESLAALAQSMFVSGTAVFLFLTGIHRLIHPQEIPYASMGLWVMVVALISTIFLVAFQRWVVQKTGSQAVSADLLHYKADVIMNTAILVALGLGYYGINHADAIFALAISVYILYSALQMGYEAVQALLDHALPAEEQQDIINIIHDWPGINGAHQLKTRQSGPMRFIQVHIELEDDLPLVEAHHITEGLEQKLLSRFPGADVIIHQDLRSMVPIERRGHWEL